MPGRGSRRGRAGGGRSLVVVGNRLPVTVRRTARGRQVVPSSGGLVTALDPVLRRHGGTWIGWAGDAGLPKGGVAEVPYRLHAVPLSAPAVERYYRGLSNGALWPLFHSLVPTSRFDPRDWAVYDEVNERFARETAAVAHDEDLVWIHDYHLLRAPLHLRRLRPEAQVAFFLHIPFPPYDVFRLLPWARHVLRGLLSCDLVGFHAEGYAHNFLRCAEEILGGWVDHDAKVVEHGPRRVQVGAFPLGIDYRLFEAEAKTARKARPDLPHRMLLGVDRLDYTKGIPERLRAFERLLVEHPAYRGEVSMVQLAVPSRSQVREYRRLKRQVDEEVGRINGRLGTAGWSPVQYLHRSVPRPRLAALYARAEVAVVTPLRDGMNLVAKEFVACQVDRPGVLVLSRLAGAAERMREALLVNPYDVEEMAEGLHRALEMPESERRSRMVALQERERRHDVHAWVAGFLRAARARRRRLHRLTAEVLETWLARVVRPPHVTVLLDYDGTLTPIRSHPREAALGARTRRTLRALAARPDTEVAVISGRALAEVRSMVGVAGVTFAGNHGLEMEGPGIEPFRHEDLAHYAGMIQRIASSLKRLAAGTRGAWVEEKGATLTFHVREAPADAREGLRGRARQAIVRAGFVARDAHRAVEARPPISWDKGSAALHLLRARWGPDWPLHTGVLYAGDDDTDEDAFRVLSGLALTIRIGGTDRPTAAARRLPDPRALTPLLEWMADRPAAPA